MTKEELKENGWSEERCKIGTLYFNGGFFGRFKDDEFILFSVEDDMHELGRVKTLDGIKVLEKSFDANKIAKLESKVIQLKKEYQKKYGETIL